MRRYWIDKQDMNAGVVNLSGELFHHVCDVCRTEVGDRFEVLVEGGQAYLVEMKQVDKKRALAEVVEQRTIAALPKPYIHLALSLPRFAKMDTIVEKSVELGVYAVHPFVSDFSFIRKVSKVPDGKRDRWSKIVRAATQQSGRGDLMQIAPVETLDNLLLDFNRQTKALGLFSYEGEGEKGLKAALQAPAARGADSVWVFVGSEGGFSHQEVEKFASIGLEPVTMGEQVLRVETACLALVSIIKYELDAMT